MLKFKKLEAVEFGDIVAQPEMTTEKRMRISQAKLLNEQHEVSESAIDALLSVFAEEKRPEIRAFMRENMSVDDLARLQIYLVMGERGLDDMEKSMQKAVAEKLNATKAGAQNGE